METEQKAFHGNFKAADMAAALTLFFSRGNLETQMLNSRDHISLQIRSRTGATSGGRTAVGVHFQDFDDGVVVTIGNQQWLGVAASIGLSALIALRNPLNLIHRIDDIAQDIEYFNLKEEIWDKLIDFAKSKNGGFKLSQKFQRVACTYCLSANPVGESNCISCGAPLGKVQPIVCSSCGYVLLHNEKKCPNCKKTIPAS